MVRKMIATVTQIESVVTPSGNSGHVVVPKEWIGKETIVTQKENRARRKKSSFISLAKPRRHKGRILQMGFPLYLIGLSCYLIYSAAAIVSQDSTLL
jgi:putative transposon-encoded protein